MDNYPIHLPQTPSVPGQKPNPPGNCPEWLTIEPLLADGYEAVVSHSSKVKTGQSAPFCLTCQGYAEHLIRKYPNAVIIDGATGAQYRYRPEHPSSW